MFVSLLVVVAAILTVLILVLGVFLYGVMGIAGSLSGGRYRREGDSVDREGGSSYIKRRDLYVPNPKLADFSAPKLTKLGTPSELLDFSVKRDNFDGAASVWDGWGFHGTRSSGKKREDPKGEDS